MKLSQMTTEKAADVLLSVLAEAQPILRDSKIAAFFKNADKKKDAADGLLEIAEILPVILGEYRQNTFNILAALNEKTPAEIAEQKITATIAQINEVFRDEELFDFFQQEQKSARKK